MNIGAVSNNAYEQFKQMKEEFLEEHRLTPDNIKKEDDWREMDTKQWDKLIEHFDKYIDAYKEDLEKRKEIQEEAAKKGAAMAPADRKMEAASRAALRAGLGFATDGTEENVSDLEKMSWTYELATDDQVVLAKAKMANEFASDIISKSQEMALTGDTVVGMSATENAKECASLEEKENKKIWIITAFTEQGIICKQTEDGITTTLWSLEYKNPNDYKRVWEFLDRVDKESDWKFAGSKSFWEGFLAGKEMDEDR